MRNTSIIRYYLGRQPGKVRREQSGVVGNHDADGFLRELLDEVTHETLRGDAHREEVERVRAGSGVLGHSRRALTLLGARDDFADGSSPETTGPELYCLIKTVV